MSIIAISGAYISKDIIIVNESIVLIFVGVLATFIVVSNYAQVKDIEKKFNKNIDSAKKELSEKFDEKIKRLKITQ